jgi:hypothetical protein
MDLKLSLWQATAEIHQMPCQGILESNSDRSTEFETFALVQNHHLLCMNPVSTREKNKAGGQKQQVADQIAGGPGQNSIRLYSPFT